MLRILILVLIQLEGKIDSLRNGSFSREIVVYLRPSTYVFFKYHGRDSNMIIVFSGLFICLLLLNSSNLTKKGKCFVIWFFLFFVSAIKSLDTGDITQYLLHFEEIKRFGLLEIFKGYGFEGIRDVGFYGIARLFSLAGLSSTVWINSISFFFAGAVAYFIYRYSDNEWISLLLVVVFYLRFSMTGLRQTVALSIILFCYKFITERKLIPFLVLVLVASVFHESALVFLPAFFISEMQYGRKQLGIIVVVSAGVVLFPGVYRQLLSMLAMRQDLQGYATSTTALSWSWFILFFSIWMISYIMYRNTIDEEARIEINRLLNLVMVGVVLQACAAIVAVSFRIGYFYNIFCIGLLPKTIMSDQVSTNKRIITIVVTISLIGYMILSGSYSNFVTVW